MRLVAGWPRLTTLKARIAIAFAILILTSATCTILIGNAIFGRKANELARARLELELAAASQALLARQSFLVALSGPLGAQVEAAAGRFDRSVCELAAGSQTFAFAGLLDETRRQALLLDARSCTTASLDGAALVAFVGSDLGAFAAVVTPRERVRSGLVVLQVAELHQLAASASGSAALAAVAARRLPSGAVLFVGSAISGELDALGIAGPPSAAAPRRETSLYLGDRRIASTSGPAALGTRAAPAVVEAVLGRGEVFAAPAARAGIAMGSAYTPLRDSRGAIVGMLGITTGEDVYGEIWRRTALLFTTIIAFGMTFGFLMAWFFSVTLTRPLKELADGMAHVADGDLDLKIRADAHDELGQLADAFNVMVRGVKERDLRLREATSEKLSQVEKQVSVGRLAAGVAHEINNPLTAILSLSILLRKSLTPDDPRREDLDVVIAETTRCRDIVKRLLDFAQERPPEKSVVDVNEVMRQTLALTSRYEALGRIRVDVRLAALPLLVDADAKQIQQVFTNVVLNAAEAMQAGGTIRVTTDEDSSGGFVVVKVQDTGKGIPRECLPRVFEPFFTTKGSGKGTGLGLSVSLGIVRKHDGAIDIESEEDRGTTVTITLPRAAPGDRERLSAAEPQGPAPEAGGA